MSGQRLTQPGVTHHDHDATAMIENYLARLIRHLPAYGPATAEVLAELRADLMEATGAGLARHADPAEAARVAIADFGDERTVAAALAPELAARRARSLGIVLLASGPLVGGAWLAAIVLSGLHTSTLGLVLLVMVTPFLIVGAPATAVTVASSGRLCRWLTPQSKISNRALAVARTAAAAGDAILLAGAALLLVLPGEDPSPTLALAVTASVARLGFVLHSIGWLARLPVLRTARRA